MDTKVYIGSTVLLYIITVIVAVSVDNLLIVFDYISALAVSGI